MPGVGAFTLIELLAVIVIVSLVTGLATMGLSASNDAAHLRAAVGQCRDLDTRARLFGRTHGPVVMSTGQDGAEILLRAIGTGELLAKVQFPAGVTVRFRAATPLESVTFDARGLSMDYGFELHGADRVSRWRVSGLTGLVREAQ